MRSCIEMLCVTLVSLFATAVLADESPLASIERRIDKEPTYESEPRYVLLALGPNAETRVWVVEDGHKLYVDKNANGDLTDDGPPIEPSDRQEWQRSADSRDISWHYEYALAEFTPAGAQTQKDFKLVRWNYDDSTADGYGMSLSLDGKTPLYAGWTDFWATSPDKASIIHFGGPLTPKMLRFKEFTIGSGSRRLSVAFVNPGLGQGANAMLSIDAPTPEVMPVLHIRWPTAGAGPPLQTTHRLNERCCYWEFYTTDFEVPAGVAVGTATATIELPEAALPLPLTATEIKVLVVAGASGSPSSP